MGGSYKGRGESFVFSSLGCKQGLRMWNWTDQNNYAMSVHVLAANLTDIELYEYIPDITGIHHLFDLYTKTIFFIFKKKKVYSE